MTDEVLIAAELFEALLAKGGRHHANVVDGPDAEARIIGVEFRPFAGVIAVKYDRPVPEPTLTTSPLLAAAIEWEDAEGANHAADFTGHEHEARERREAAVANLRAAIAEYRK